MENLLSPPSTKRPWKRGITTAQREKDELLAEYKDSDELETLQELLEDYDADAIKAFVEYFGTGMLEISPIYQGEMSGASSPNSTPKTATVWTCLDSLRSTGKQLGRIWSVTTTVSRTVTSSPATSDHLGNWHT